MLPGPETTPADPDVAVPPLGPCWQHGTAGAYLAVIGSTTSLGPTPALEHCRKVHCALLGYLNRATCQSFASVLFDLCTSPHASGQRASGPFGTLSRL